MPSSIASGMVSSMANIENVATTEQDEKVRENRLRRAAERQGLLLKKSRRRDPRAIDYGTYMIVDAATNTLTAGERMTLDEVEWCITK